MSNFRVIIIVDQTAPEVIHNIDGVIAYDDIKDKLALEHVLKRTGLSDEVVMGILEKVQSGNN